MKKFTDAPNEDLRSGLLGLGERSIRKSHYAQLQQRLSELERFRALIDQAHDMIFLVQPGGVILDVNATACRLLKRTDDDLKGSLIQDYLEVPWTRLLQNMAEREPGRRSLVLESTVFSALGESIVVELTISGAPFGDQEYYVLVLRDMTERKWAEDRIRTLAFYDILTGLANRMLLKERLFQALTERNRTNQLIGVLLLDVDRFKVLNDSLGYERGDALLQQIADRLRDFGDQIMPARIGGDEFVVLMTARQDMEEIANYAQRLLKHLSEAYHLGEQDVFLSVSIGVAVAPGDGATAEQLLRNSEIAMYRAKEQGRNQCRFYTSYLDRVWAERVQMEVAMRKGIAEQEFSLVYQPQVDAGNGSLLGFEALVRWHRQETGETIYPDRFIPLAEDSGLILPLGRQILQMALAQLRCWLDAGRQVKRMAVNLSSKQILDPLLMETVFSLLKEYQLAASLLELEITESAAMGQEKDVIEILSDFRRRGVVLALDDFGTGYSSLSYLRLLPIHVVKIDRSFVADVSTSRDNAAIVKATVAMAKGLDLEVVAEGVETAEEVDVLRTCGVDRMQGYLFSRPETSEELDKWIWAAKWL